MNQRTIRTPVEMSGVGLYKNKPCRVRLLPAPPNSGICFYAPDPIPARLRYARVSEGMVVLRLGQSEVWGVEHLLSACYGLGIDQLRVEVSGGELPMGDGSGGWAVDLLERAGLVELHSPRWELRVRSPKVVIGQGGFLAILPAPQLRVFCYTSFDRGLRRREWLNFRLNPRRFKEGLAWARTFGPPQDPRIAHLLPFKVRWVGDWLLPLEPRGGRELVRHKVLDLLGDLALLGRWVQGWILAYRSGHRLNLRLLTHLEGMRDGDR